MIARRPLLAASLLATAGLRPAAAQDRPPPRKVHIAQANAALAFLPLMAARAFDTFPAQNLDLFWAALPGGDPACLAALESGDIEFAAMGAISILAAIAQGRPVQMVACLMARLPFELVVSNRRIQAFGVSPGDDPLATRLQLLKGATIGVGVLGGLQEFAARWLARQAGLDPRSDVKILPFGGPVFLQGALEAGQIDAFLLSPPQGLITEDTRIGQVVIRLADDFPQAATLPTLVLAARTPIPPETASLLVSTCKALQAATDQILADPRAAASRIQAALYPRLNPAIIATSLERLRPGIVDHGRFEPQAIATLFAYSGIQLDPATPFYTNKYVDEAAKG